MLISYERPTRLKRQGDRLPPFGGQSESSRARERLFLRLDSLGTVVLLREFLHGGRGTNEGNTGRGRRD